MPVLKKTSDLLISLAVASARGESTAAWSRSNGVSTRTCQVWKHSAEYQAIRVTVRDRFVRDALEKLAGSLEMGFNIICDIAKNDPSSTMRAKAARALVADYAILSTCPLDQPTLTSLAARIAELEKGSDDAQGASPGRSFSPN